VDGLLHVLGDGESHRAGQPAARLGEPIQELVGPAARVCADQRPPPQVATQLRQGQPGGLDVAGGVLG
jgi:hypothetical protein